MYVFISKKLSFFLFICSGLAAFGLVFFLNYSFTGPKLGPVYDILLGFRPDPHVSADILLIDSEEIIDSQDIFTVVMTLSEMGASDLIIEVPVLGASSGRPDDSEELSIRVNDEFSVIKGNIRNLFDAIRLGFISPEESHQMVDNLTELSDMGRDRLNAVILRQDAGTVQAARAAAVFGRVTMAFDLHAQVPDNLPWYSRSRPDKDRVLRRIAPVSETGIDNIAYHALKYCWTETFIETSEYKSELINRYIFQGEETENRFRFDSEGNILIEKPGKNNCFRRLDLEIFREYDRAERAMARLLKDVRPLGVYTEVLPEQIPLMQYDYAESLKEELLVRPNENNLTAWLNARYQYFESLDEFLYGPSEMSLVNGYEELIAGEGLGDEGIYKLQIMRDELIRAFVDMRYKYFELNELRELLAKSLDASFCIMKPAHPENTGQNDSTALLANALLTGHSITPGRGLFIIIWSFAASMIILFCIHRMRPGMLLLTGLGSGLACAFIFSLIFILGSYWIDPFIPMTACFGGTLVLVVSRFCIGYNREFRFRLVYGPTVSKVMLRRLVKAGRPLLSEKLCTHAAIIAVKNQSLADLEDKGNVQDTAKAAADFRHSFSRVFKHEGAFIIGFSGETALACFGSPQERLCLEDDINPAEKAVNFVSTLLKNPLYKDWHFGIESGECIFYWPGDTSYTVNGRPVLRAKLYSSLTSRFNVRTIMGETVKKDTGLEPKKLAALAGENFYEL